MKNWLEIKVSAYWKFYQFTTNKRYFVLTDIKRLRYISRNIRQRKTFLLASAGINQSHWHVGLLKNFLKSLLSVQVFSIYELFEVKGG